MQEQKFPPDMPKVPLAQCKVDVVGVYPEGVDQQPEVIQEIAIAYPASAEQKGIENGIGQAIGQLHVFGGLIIRSPGGDVVKFYPVSTFDHIEYRVHRVSLL
jgi:hypothetical protein